MKNIVLWICRWLRYTVLVFTEGKEIKIDNVIHTYLGTSSSCRVCTLCRHRDNDDLQNLGEDGYTHVYVYEFRFHMWQSSLPKRTTNSKLHVLTKKVFYWRQKCFKGVFELVSYADYQFTHALNSSDDRALVGFHSLTLMEKRFISKTLQCHNVQIIGLVVCAISQR